ncbi:MAG: PepSY domain-containing protein [Flavobacteriaceae bacterium]|nr:PepSY domain-containing protein [Flavobacteriaceae bacterium]
MSKRSYNVFLHTHTVSGIVISVALYIIFFAGAFALIKDEITVWEKGINYTRNIEENSIDYDVLVEKIKAEKHELYGRDIRIVIDEVSPEIFISLSASQDSLAPESSRKYDYFNINKNTYRISDYYEFYSFGELLYRLHFFNQIPIIGIYIAGFVAFFFLFAIVTGVIVHWKKMISNFYVFRPTAKLKTIWTDAHTVLGVIGLPFQFIYALTSCFFCLSVLVLLPANFLYDNDQQQLMEDLRPMSISYPIETRSNQEFTLNQFRDQTLVKWEHLSIKQVYVRNYGATNMKFQIDGVVDDEFIGNGRIIYDVQTGKVEAIKNPYKANYLEGVEFTIRRLHFGDYGGLILKIIYFILALITCFVIITGVLMWLEARNKKNVPEAQKLFNQKVGYIYLAICLSMYPITAFTFIIAKLLPRSLDASRQSILYTVFFGLWFVVSIVFTLKRNNYYTNKICLKAGSSFAFSIPIINGVISGNWIWNTIQTKQYDILFIDLFWIVFGIATLFITLKLKKSPQIHKVK